MCDERREIIAWSFKTRKRGPLWQPPLHQAHSSMPDINSLPPSALSPPPLSSSSASASSPAPASGSVSASASAMSANANANGSEPVPAHGPNSSPSPNRSASTSLQAAAAVNAGLQHERSSNSRRMMLPNPYSNPGQSRHSHYRLHT